MKLPTLTLLLTSFVRGGSAPLAAVWTDSLCFEQDVPITASFDGVTPTDGSTSEEWVGIYPATDDLPTAGSVEEPLVWLYTCGSQSCSGALTAGDVSFGMDGPFCMGEAELPLTVGMYAPVLVRNESSTYHVLAVGETFEIKLNCQNDEEDLQQVSRRTGWWYPSPPQYWYPAPAPKPAPRPSPCTWWCPSPPKPAPMPYPRPAPRPSPGWGPAPKPKPRPSPGWGPAPAPKPKPSPGWGGW